MIFIFINHDSDAFVIFLFINVIQKFFAHHKDWLVLRNRYSHLT